MTGKGPERREHFRGAGAKHSELRRQHSDDEMADSSDGNELAHDVRSGAHSSLPEAVADNHRLLVSDPELLAELARHKQAAYGRLYAQEPEKPFGYVNVRDR